MISPELLRRYSLFSSLGHEHLAALAMIGEMVEYEAGQEIFQADAPATHLCFVHEGKVDLSIEFPGGKKKNWMEITSGFLLCWSSVVEPYRYTCSAYAVDSVRMMKFDGAKLRDMMEKDHDLGFALMKQVAKAISERLKSIRMMFISLIATY